MQHVGLARNAFSRLPPSFFAWLSANSERTASLDANPIVNLAWPPPLKHLPASLWTFRQLEVLTLCCSADIKGTLPDSISRLSNLKYFTIRRSGISGTIPSQLFSIPSLVSIDIEGAIGINGTLPSMGKLSNLQLLDVSSLALSGSIPSSIVAAQSSLQKFDVSRTPIAGTLRDVVKLTKLTSLNLGNTRLTGTIPTQVGKLTDLSSLALYGTDVHGSIRVNFLSFRSSLV